MQKIALVVLVCVGLLAFASSDAGTGYKVVHGWPQVPEGTVLGQCVGVAVDSHNHVWLFHRVDQEWTDPFPTTLIAAPTLYMFDGNTGALLSAIGGNQFLMPHGLNVDSQDNLFVTDVGLHQVLKLSHDGKLLLTLGEARTPGSNSTHFNRPTDVAILPDNSFYVSDGYENTRVLKFTAEGKFEFEWGTKGSGEGEFDLPHGIAVDPGRNAVYVADRSNSRIQVFDLDGKFRALWKSNEIGRPFGVAIGLDGNVFAIDGGDLPENPPDRSRAVEIDRSGRVLETFGTFGNYDGQLWVGHDIAVGKDGAVYVADAAGQRIQKFVK